MKLEYLNTDEFTIADEIIPEARLFMGGNNYTASYLHDPSIMIHRYNLDAFKDKVKLEVSNVGGVDCYNVHGGKIKPFYYLPIYQAFADTFIQRRWHYDYTHALDGDVNNVCDSNIVRMPTPMDYVLDAYRKIHVEHSGPAWVITPVAKPVFSCTAEEVAIVFDLDIGETERELTSHCLFDNDKWMSPMILCQRDENGEVYKGMGRVVSYGISPFLNFCYSSMKVNLQDIEEILHGNSLTTGFRIYI